MKLESIRCPGCCGEEAAEYVVFCGDCSTVSQPWVEEVNSGAGGVYCIEFCQRAALLLYHRVLERMGGLV